MTELKKEQTELEDGIVQLKNTKAQKVKELFEANKNLDDTKASKEAIEANLKSIKAGCDFIETNFDLREERRASETAALGKAITLIKATPAYQSAEAEADI